MVRAESMSKQFEADDMMLATLVPTPTGVDVQACHKNIVLERVKNSGHMRVIKTKVHELQVTAISDHEKATAKVARLFEDEGISSGVNHAKNELKAKLDAVCEACASAEADLAEKLLMDPTQLGFVELNLQRKQADDIIKAITKTSLKIYHHALKAFVKVIEGIVREQKMAESAADEVAEPLHLPPLVAILTGLAAAGDEGVGTSYFEAKMGLKPALVAAEKDADPSSIITKLAKTKKAQKDLFTHLKTVPAGVQPILDDPTRRKVKKKLMKGFDSSLFSQLTLPQVDWASKVYTPEFYGLSGKGLLVNMPPFCAMECRLLLAGDEIIMGLPVDAIPHVDFKDKRKFMFVATIDELSSLIKDRGGFIMHHDSTKLAVIPSGFLTAIYSKNAFGLRWSVSSDENDTNRMKDCLTHLIKAFPEMGNASTGHSQWLQWLNSI